MTWEHRCGTASWRNGALVVGVGLLHQPSHAVDLHGEAISGRCAVLREITTATQPAAHRGATTLSEYGGNNRVPSSSMPPPRIDSGNTVAVPSRACRPCGSRYNWVLRQLCEDLYGNLGGQANMMPSQSAGASCGLFYSDFYLPGSEHMECTNTGYILQIEDFLAKADEEPVSKCLAKSGEILCEHKDKGAEHFSHGLCEECYDNFTELSGGLEGGADPPAFQRAEKQRLDAAKRAKEAAVVEAICELHNYDFEDDIMSPGKKSGGKSSTITSSQIANDFVDFKDSEVEGLLVLV